MRVLAETARFELDELVLNDYGHIQTLDDASLAEVLQSPFVRGLTSLSLFGCDRARNATAIAIPMMECAPRLRGLNLGSLRYAGFAATLADCTFPRLVALSIRQDNVTGKDLAPVARFPTLEKLAADMNLLSGSDLGPVLVRLPKLVELSLCDNPLGSIYAIASTQFAHVLRRLDLSSCRRRSDRRDDREWQARRSARARPRLE